LARVHALLVCTRMTRMTLGLLVLAGCAGEAAPNAVGLTYTTVQDDLVAGTFHTAYGDLAFTSRVVSDGVVDVTFDRGHGAFGSHVDWSKLTNDLQFQPGFKVTTDDRFLLKALSTAVESDLVDAGVASENLVRQANLWGHHPEGDIIQPHIVADSQRGWTTLCNVRAYTFNHDAWNHGQQYEYLGAGLGETANPCRDRCGPGCTAWWGTSAWTQDCGNHDRCEQMHNSVSCTDEFTFASDDFTFAPNCPY
jgi:hypothetical protein